MPSESRHVRVCKGYRENLVRGQTHSSLGGPGLWQASLISHACLDRASDSSARDYSQPYQSSDGEKLPPFLG